MKTKSAPAPVSTLLTAGLVALLLSAPAPGAVERYTIMASGRPIGTLVADGTGSTTRISYDYKNNGRGPTIAETVQVDSAGLPTSWTVTGSTTFGSKVDETFRLDGAQASWRDATGPGSTTVKGPALYVAQSASPWALGLYARALAKAGGSLRRCLAAR